MFLSTRVVARLTESRVLAENGSGAIEIAFCSAIFATGARELMLPFPGWTLPNVFAAGGLQALVKSGFPVQGKRIVIAGTGPLLLAVAAFLNSQGARIEGVFEQSSWSRVIRLASLLAARPTILGSALRYGVQLRGARFRCGWWPVSAEGTDCVRTVTVTNGSQVEAIDCDLIACGFHLVPNTELQSAFLCTLAEDRVRIDEWQRTSAPGIFSAGESTGIGGLELALVEGQIAGFAATGKKDQASRLFGKRNALAKWADAMDSAFALRPELRQLVRPDTIVCRCEDVRWSQLYSQRSFRSARLYTRCGMGPCQGRICGAALRFLSEWNSEFTRPPVYPVRLATLIREPQTLPNTKPGSDLAHS
jgi:NADPH-dependent 2,4-dienoyl-CoA reductase/sulfur reductase-like enzyme